MILAQAVDYASQSHWPWLVKIPFIVLAARFVIWVIGKLPKENKSVQQPARRPAAARSARRPSSVTHAHPAPATATEILVLKDGAQLGPFSLDELNRRLAAGSIHASDLAWHEGLADWQPLGSIAGVVPSHAHHLHPPPPPAGHAVWPPPTANDSASGSSNGLLIAGYVCAAVSLLFFPPLLGLAGIVCGVFVIKRQEVNKGVALMVVSFACAALGMMIGAAS